MTEQQEVPEVESIEVEQAYQFDSASEEMDYLHPTSTNNVAILDKGSLFLVGRSSRFGRSAKNNSRFLS